MPAAKACYSDQTDKVVTYLKVSIGTLLLFGTPTFNRLSCKKQNQDKS